MWPVERSWVPLNYETSFWVQLRSEPACIPAEPECHYTDSAEFSQYQSRDEASSSLLLLWSLWWWSTCSSIQTVTTRYCWCFLRSTSAPCLPSPAQQTCTSQQPCPLGWKPGPHTAPEGSVPATRLAFAGLFLQRPPCPYRCWWSATGPRIVAAVL